LRGGVTDTPALRKIPGNEKLVEIATQRNPHHRLTTPADLGGAIAEIRNAAQPASAGTLVLSRGAEEDATFASQGVQQLERSIAAYRVLLCCELVGAVRLLRQRRLDDQFSGGVGDALSLAGVLPRDTEDRDLRGDIVVAESLLDDIGRLVPPETRP